MISVAVCTWNRAALLRQCLQQMTRLRIPAALDWELLVVNNNCSDHTDEVVESFGTRLPIRLIHEARPGLSHARNAAIACARGDYLLWTDDDALVDAGWLEAYAQAFRRWPDAVVFGGPVLPRFEGTAPGWLLACWPQIGFAYAHRDLGPTPFALSPGGRGLPFGANYALRIGEQRSHPYDPALGRRQHGKALLSGEETLVIETLLRAGRTGWWLPEARVEHWIPRERQGTEYLRRYFEGRGRVSALSPGTAVSLFGRPRWAWRQAVVEELRYRALRRWAKPQAWVPAMVRASEAWGIIKGPIRDGAARTASATSSRETGVQA